MIPRGVNLKEGDPYPRKDFTPLNHVGVWGRREVRYLPIRDRLITHVKSRASRPHLKVHHVQSSLLNHFLEPTSSPNQTKQCQISSNAELQKQETILNLRTQPYQALSIHLIGNVSKNNHPSDHPSDVHLFHILPTLE